MESGDAGILAGFGCYSFFMLAVGILYIAGMWKVYTKAGKPGWAAIVPIYNVIVLLELAGRPTWWVLLFFIPAVNIVIIAMVSLDVAASFGQSAAYGIGLWLLGWIFFPMLGFGSAQYVGPAAAQGPPQGGQAY